MTKNLKNLNKLKGHETAEKISSAKNLKYDKSNKGIFEHFLNSIEDKENNKNLILSEYINKFEYTLKDIENIGITIENLKNSHTNISKNLQYKISQIFLEKLYEKIKKNSEFCESFTTDFGNIKKSKIDTNTLISKLPGYEGYTHDISITNGEIFNKLTNLYQYKKISEQSPSNKKIIGELLDLEFGSTIDNFHLNSGETYQSIGDLFVPNGYISKILETTNMHIEKLIQKKENLESLDLPNDNQKSEINKINKEIWNEYIAYLAQNEKTKKLANIFQKLVKNNFNFGQLDKLEKSIITQSDIVSDINQPNINIDINRYKNFLQELYDFSKSRHTIDLGDEILQLDIKKSFEEGEHANFQNIKNLNELPLTFVVNIDKNSPELITEIEDPQNTVLSREMTTDGVISSYTTKNGTMRIGNDYLLEIGGVQINAKILDKLLNCDPHDLEKILKKYNLYQQFSKKNYNNDFSKFLANSDVKILKRNLKFDGKNTNKISQIYLLSLLNSPKKLVENDKILDELISGTKRESKESDEIVKEYAQALYNYLGDSIEIYDDFDSNDSYESPYTFGDDIYTQAQNLFDKLDQEGKENFINEFKELCENDVEGFLGGRGPNIAEDIISTINNDSTTNTNTDTNPDTNTNNNTVKEIADTPEKAFEKEWTKIYGNKNCKFEEGTRLYIKKPGLSELPPHNTQDSFFVFEICNIQGEPGSGTFGLKVIGNEIPLACPDKIYEDLPYTAERLALLAESGKIFKMPKRDDTSRLGCIKRVQESDAIKNLTAFGELEKQVKLKGDQFVDQEGNIVKYFCHEENDIDIEKDSNGNPTKAKQGKNFSKYEIKGINTKKGTIKIASNFDGTDLSTPGEVKDVKYKYENELTFEQFILFIETKQLKGYNEQQEKEMEIKYNTEKKDRLANRGIFHKVSIGNFISVFKDGAKKIKDLWKENQKDQEEHLENFLLSNEGLNLYKHMGNIISLGGLFGDVKTAFDEAELDYYNNRDERIWKKIDKRYKKFGSDPIYPAEFASHLKSLLMREKNIYRGEDKDRYKFAAAVLIMLKKEGPYPRDFKNKPGEGYWVESFLGEGHKTRFLNFYKKKLQNINDVKDMGYSSSVRMDMMEELNKMEFQYIISVIDGAAPYNSDDENAQKSIWSAKFKDELQANLDGYFNKHEEEKNKINTFFAAEEAYLRTLGAGRFNKALPALERMCEKASTPGEIFRLKGYILSAMLMGCIDYNSAASTMKSFWKTARSMGFSPLCRVRDPNHPEKIQKLLQGISEGDTKIQNFTETTKFNIKNFTPSNEGLLGDYGKANACILNYREKNGKQILKYIENPIFYDKESSSPENSINAKAKAKGYPNREIFGDIVKFHNDDDQGNINPNVNSINFIKVAPLTAKGNIMKKYMPTGGVYKTDKEEDISDAKDARNSIAQEVGKATSNNVESFIKFFFNVIGYAVDPSELVRTISLIEELKNKGLNNEAKYIWWYIFNGNIHKNRQGPFPDEFAGCINNFSKLFYDSIGTTINSTVIKNALGAGLVNDYKKPYKMVNRNQWNSQMGGDDIYNHSGGAFANNLRNLGYYQEDTINYKIKEIKKTLKRQGVSFKKIPESFSTSNTNFNFIYDEENNNYTTRENSIPIPTTKQTA